MTKKKLRKQKFTRRTLAAVVVASVAVATPSMISAATPRVATDDGAFVKLLGNPADGTAKFQFGWDESTPASGAAGYWIGLYDVTNSHYEWSSDTGPIDLPDSFFRNARPTADLPNGDYKVVFFVRGTYEPATNLAEIELPFTVSNSMG